MRYALALIYLLLMPFLLLSAAVYNLFNKSTPQHRAENRPRREPAE
jgi:hypothetical protein